MKSKPLTSTVLLFLAAAALALNTNAEDKKSSLSSSDEAFVKKTGQAGMDEVKLAELGTQKAERADVKEFATMLVTDHTKANDELKNLAATKGVQLSAVVSPDASEAFKDLEKESGASFDKAFLDHMEKDHKKDIDAFEDKEKDADDADLKAWVSKTLPTLKAHLQRVKELKGK